MRKILITAALFCLVLGGCTIKQNVETYASSENTSAPVRNGLLPDTVISSYYEGQGSKAYDMLQQENFQRMLEEWTYEDTVNPVWNFETFARIQILDHDMNSLTRDGVELYYCTYSADNGIHGYVILDYDEEGPGLDKWTLHETEQLYDLEANIEAITASLQKTDIDLTTASAMRVAWQDTDRNRGDQVILFTDGKGDRYVCYLGDFSIEKQ